MNIFKPGTVTSHGLENSVTGEVYLCEEGESIMALRDRLLGRGILCKEVHFIKSMEANSTAVKNWPDWKFCLD